MHNNNIDKVVVDPEGLRIFNNINEVVNLMTPKLGTQTRAVPALLSNLFAFKILHALYSDALRKRIKFNGKQ